jgi:biotin synthase-related radical SAM superfamily protein
MASVCSSWDTINNICTNVKANLIPNKLKFTVEYYKRMRNIYIFHFIPTANYSFLIERTFLPWIR